MKTFLAACLGAVAAVIVLVAFFGEPGTWRPVRPDFDRWFAPKAQPTDHRQAARARDERQRAVAAADELQEQRRERLTLLTATLGANPMGPLRPAEQRLFQAAQRNRARTAAAVEQRAMLRLVAPVQIDEWTVVEAGTPVAFLGYNRDNVVTIEHQGARYEIAAWQAGLPPAESLSNSTDTPPTMDERRIEYPTQLGSLH